MNILEWLESPPLRKLIYVLFLLLLVYFIVFFIKKMLNKVIESTESKYRARKAINILGYVVIVLVALFIYSEQLGNFGMFLGVTGAGIAFALQEVIVSFAGWIFIIFSNKVIVGQRVKIGELKGDIIDIGILTSTFMEIGDWVNGDLYNGRIVTLSNSYVFREKIQNYSAEYPFLWDEVEIPIRHGSDYKMAKQLFETIAAEICGEYAQKSQSKWHAMTNKFNVEKAEVKPMVTMCFDQNWITFTIRYIVDYKKRRSTKDSIFTRVIDEIGIHGDKIKIATSAMEVTLPPNK
jgi:small-conductance mechanosensitive channel